MGVPVTGGMTMDPASRLEEARRFREAPFNVGQLVYVDHNGRRTAGTVMEMLDNDMVRVGIREGDLVLPRSQVQVWTPGHINPLHPRRLNKAVR